MESYKIVVPSRKRPGNMATITRLFPSALVAVHRDEQGDYRPVVAKKNLLLHDAARGLPSVRNWLNKRIQEDVLVMIEDDVNCVVTLTRPRAGRRKLKDPDRIREIIENTARVASDLEISAFCWSRSLNKVAVEPRITPIRLTAPLGTAFGIRGAARRRRFDPELLARADIDFTLQTLLVDRIVYADVRYHFDAGRIFSGAGGNAGLVGPQEFDHSTKVLLHRWGEFVSVQQQGYEAGRRNRSVSPLSVRVKRRNPLAD